MDRFIALKGLYEVINLLNLKSNIDRFIENTTSCTEHIYLNLKSNMDRFIGLVSNTLVSVIRYLKSNMDRFIGKAQKEK